MYKTTFTKDIFEEVAEEMGVSVEAVNHCHNAIIARLKHLVNKTNATSIFIPHLGTLFSNFQYLNRVYDKNLKKVNPDLEKKEILASKLIKIEKYNQEVEERIREKNTRIVNRHLQKSFLNNNFLAKFKTLEEIENIQNEYYETRK